MMKKLIASLARIPFSMLATQFPAAPTCFYALRNLVPDVIFSNTHQAIVAMDLKTHACRFNCEQPILITKVGYRAWRKGITYRISLWQAGKNAPLASCLVSPLNTSELQFFSLKRPVRAYPDSTYYISRTYISGGPYHNMTDYVGWLNKKDGKAVYPLKQNVITLANGFFSDEANPLNSEGMSDINTCMLLPMIDFEYVL